MSACGNADRLIMPCGGIACDPREAARTAHRQEFEVMKKHAGQAPGLPITIIADTREQRIPPFPRNVEIVRQCLSEGDYTTPRLKGRAAIERKNLQDLIGSLTHDRDRFMRELERLRSYEFRCVIVEASLDDIVAGRYRTRAHPNAILGGVASLFAKYGCPVLFAGNPRECGSMITRLLLKLHEVELVKVIK